MVPIVNFRRVTISPILIVLILFISSFFVIYFTGLHKFLINVLNLPPTTVGLAVLVILIGSGIIGLSIWVLRLMKCGPVTIPIPMMFLYLHHLFLPLKSSKKRLSRTELREKFEFSGGCKILRNGCLAKGDKKFTNSNMKYKPSKPSSPMLTIAASFKAKTTNTRHQYWRYGIAIRDNSEGLALLHLDSADYQPAKGEAMKRNSEGLALFHLDSDDLIVLYINNKLFLRYKSEISFSNRTVRLKACISKENDTRIISFFLDETLIYQKIDGEISQDCSVSINVWSDENKDHNVRIRDIWIGN